MIGATSPPSSTTPLPRTSYFDKTATSACNSTGEAAARLFIKGLAIELGKPLPLTAVGRQSDSGEDETEGSAEGLSFCAERALDLTVGVN